MVFVFPFILIGYVGHFNLEFLPFIFLFYVVADFLDFLFGFIY